MNEKKRAIVLFPPEEHHALVEAARRQGRTMAEIIRRAVRAFLRGAYPPVRTRKPARDQEKKGGSPA